MDPVGIKINVIDTFNQGFPPHYVRYSKVIPRIGEEVRLANGGKFAIGIVKNLLVDISNQDRPVIILVEVTKPE